MNPIQLFEYGKSRGANLAPNTFIGGISGTTNTAQLLADKLKNYPSGSIFSAANIQNFSIVGDDIECYISTEYRIRQSAFNGVEITYFEDLDKCKAMDIFSFSSASNLEYVIFPVLDSIANYSASALQNFLNCKQLKTAYFPLCMYYGPDLAQGGSAGGPIFDGAGNGYDFKVYANNYFSTNIDGDLTYVENVRGGDVVYINNQTAPSPITDLSVGTIYGAAVQLNFTAPLGSTNAIDFYEVYANGRYKGRIQAGGYCLNLTLNTNYILEVKPVDIYFNKSTSNTVSQTTAATTSYQDFIIFYYKTEGNVLDNFGVNNGTATAITYATGLVGQTAVFNGTTSQIKATSQDFDFFGTAKLSMVAVINLAALPASGKEYGIIAIQERDTAGTVDKEIRITPTGQAYYYAFDGAQKKAISAAGEIAINTNYVLIGTYDGVNLKIYINSVLKATLAASSTFNFTSPTLVISHISGTDVAVNGKVSEVGIFNTDLTATRVSDVTSKLQSGQSLI